MKTKTYLLVLLLPFMFSCAGLLDTDPVDRLNPSNFWKTSKDANSALNALYKWLPNIGEISNDGMTDIATYNFESASQVRILCGEQTADMSYFLDKYRNLYKAIHDVNYFIENVQLVLNNDPLYTEDIMLNQIAQARVIRAITYMQLVFLFGDVPLITKTLSLDESRNVTQSDKEEIIDFISKELSESSKYLKETYNDDPQNIGHITKGAALGMKARAMLYAGRYDEAAKAAKAVMDLGIYSLYPYFSKLFSYEAKNNSEVILDYQYEKSLKSNSVFNSYAPKGMFGSNALAPNYNLIEIFETLDGNSVDSYNPYKNRDPRLGYTVWLPSFSDEVKGDLLYNNVIFDSRPGSGTIDEVNVDFQRSKTGYAMKKYINPEDLSDRSNCGINYIILRYADVLLMYAEAKIELNQIDNSVYEAVNMVRNGREDVKMSSIPEGQTQETFREIIRAERVKELALEGLRFWDIRRWKIAEDVIKGPIPGMKYISVGDSSADGKIEQFIYGGIYRSFNPNRDYLYPIPKQELDLNSNLKQNPGY